MALPNGAGQLRDRVAFERRAGEPDGGGGTTIDWRPQFEAAAAIVGRFGGETVMAARLDGRAPATITVRYSSKTKLVAPDWRIRDVRSGRIYNIRSVDDRETRHEWIDILAESGVAT